MVKVEAVLTVFLNIYSTCHVTPQHTSPSSTNMVPKSYENVLTNKDSFKWPNFTLCSL